MPVGTTKPELQQDWMDKNLFWKGLAQAERASSWFFFLFNNVAIFRLIVESIAAGLLIYGALGVFGEFEQKEVDRRVRVATLFAQVAETHALPDGKGLRALKPGVEALVRDGVPMPDFDLSGAYLVEADLRNADLSATILTGALLKRANLSGSTLFRANLSHAHLLGANLSSAFLFRARLTRAYLKRADLTNVVLDGSFVDFANFHGADLTKASLVGTYLSHTEFVGAVVRRANLTRAVLVNTNFLGADVTGAIFDGADLTNADLSAAKGIAPNQLDVACAAPGNPPILPDSRRWNGKKCSITNQE